MPMMTSQILKFVDFTHKKTPQNLDISRTEHFFLQIKKFINYTSRATLLQKQFCSGGDL